MRKWTNLAEKVWKMKSWTSGSTESGTSYRWQLRQRRSAEAELHTFGSPDNDEMRKRTNVAEKVCKMKSWPSGSTKSGTSDLCQSRQSKSAEAELHVCGSSSRDDVQK